MDRARVLDLLNGAKRITVKTFFICMSEIIVVKGEHNTPDFCPNVFRDMIDVGLDSEEFQSVFDIKGEFSDREVVSFHGKITDEKGYLTRFTPNDDEHKIYKIECEREETFAPAVPCITFTTVYVMHPAK